MASSQLPRSSSCISRYLSSERRREGEGREGREGEREGREGGRGREGGMEGGRDGRREGEGVDYGLGEN